MKLPNPLGEIAGVHRQQTGSMGFGPDRKTAVSNGDEVMPDNFVPDIGTQSLQYTSNAS
jgi:hypothetical protein